MNQEQWRPVTGYEGAYEVSSYGRIKSLKKGALMQPGQLKKGYPMVELYRSGKGKDYPIHRLVAIAFISNPEDKPQVNHLDGNKTNNNIYNLEWATAQENITHAHYMKLSFNPLKVTLEDFKALKAEYAEIMKGLAIKYNISESKIRDYLLLKKYKSG